MSHPLSSPIFVPSRISDHESCVVAVASAVRSAVIGHLDEDIDVDIDWSKVQAEPLKPVVH